jgi:hypothetical protein
MTQHFLPRQISRQNERDVQDEDTFKINFRAKFWGLLARLWHDFFEIFNESELTVFGSYDDETFIPVAVMKFLFGFLAVWI